MSDSEFETVVAGELQVSVPNPKPILPREFGTERREDNEAGKALGTVLTAKSAKFIDKLLEVGVERIADVLSRGVTKVGLYAVRKIPFADLIVDWIKDKVAGNALNQLVNDYKVDRERRLFLNRLGWGTYQDPERPRPLSASDFSRQVMSRN